MKIVSNFLEDIEGIEIWYIIGLVIFVALFIVIVIRTYKRPKREMDEIKNSILEDDEENSQKL